MKIGIFDSGLGGLFILKSIIKKLPQYDYFYLGDTQRTPYGTRSHAAVYQFTKEAVGYLFHQNCQLIILACNTASARALRKIQGEYLPKNYPSKRVLGVVIPTAEAIFENKMEPKRIGTLATQGTVNSGAFIKEIRKINKEVKIFQQAAPLLVPLVENDGLKWAEPILRKYLRSLLSERINALVLGCTHYPILKNKIRKIIGKNIRIISQDGIIPAKLKNYLQRHSEIEKKLTQKRKRIFAVTDLTENFQHTAQKWLGRNIKLKKIRLKPLV